MPSQSTRAARSSATMGTPPTRTASFIAVALTPPWTIQPPAATQYTYACSMNDNGQVVGMYGDATGEYGFLYNGGTYTTLADPAATQGSTTALWINHTEQVVG